MRRFAFTAVAVLGLAACTTYEGSVDNPVERSFSWFSYVAGDDIRAACRAGSPDRYRFVYNGVYQRQIRAYDLRLNEDGGELTSRARDKPGNVANFQFLNPLGPWELRRSVARLTGVDVAEIVDGLQRDVAAAPVSAGQRLRSNKFYWVVAACQSGMFRLHAFEQDRVELGALTFRGPLLAHDKTNVDFAEAKQIEGFSDGSFEIRINKSGDGTVGLF